MFNKLISFLSSAAPSQPKPRRRLEANTWPAAIYAIGDVHGCLRELKQLEADIINDAETFPGEKWLIMLGDYVDRGPDSANVLEHLIESRPPGLQTIYLTGNHEIMMEEFILRPNMKSSWLRNGGIETLLSYGVDMESLERLPADNRSDMLRTKIPASHQKFLRELDALVVVNDTIFVHAGIRPGILTANQSEADLFWIRDEFYDAPPIPGLRVVHGHTPASQPVNLPNRICVDTGAYATGRLTAVRLAPGTEPHFMTVNGPVQ